MKFSVISNVIGPLGGVALNAEPDISTQREANRIAGIVATRISRSTGLRLSGPIDKTDGGVLFTLWTKKAEEEVIVADVQSAVAEG